VPHPEREAPASGTDGRRGDGPAPAHLRALPARRGLDEAVSYVEGLRHRGERPGVERMRWLCGALGHPERAAPAVHVTGTNGKGSTAKMVAALLGAAGHRVGLYTSPHLVDITERTVLGGAPIGEDTFARLVERLRPTFAAAGSALGEPVTHFDALTTVALVAFAEAAVDAAVMEVGIGGANDDTNVVDAAVAVVTNVDLDHTRSLGTTRAEIAMEKAGVIKDGATAVVGDVDDDVAAVLIGRCRAVGAVPWRVGSEVRLLSQGPAAGGRLVVVDTPARRYEALVPLRGAHQAANAACALAAAEAFVGRGLTDDEVRAGFGSVVNPAHLEYVGDGPSAVVDVAHNPHGAVALAAALEEAFGDRPRVLVFGTGPDKDAAGMLGHLRPHVRAAVCTEYAHAPHRDAAALADLAASLGYPAVSAVPDPAAAVAAAAGLAGSDLVVLTGSHYWIGAVHPALRAAFGRRGAQPPSS
jgi:dihydrofolate synthase / folylpolyglutamate synthase